MRVAIVPGVTPGKWERVWRERSRVPLEIELIEESEQRMVLLEGRADMALVRLPIDREGLHLIPLYAERPVVVVAQDHVLSVFEETTAADLADELVLAVGPALTAHDAIAAVAAGTGVVIVPMSVARLHHRKDVLAVPVADLPETQIGLAWRVDNEDPQVQEFIGVVRGRTPNSSR